MIDCKSGIAISVRFSWPDAQRSHELLQPVGRLGSGPIGVSTKSRWSERGISSAHSVRATPNHQVSQEMNSLGLVLSNAANRLFPSPLSARGYTQTTPPRPRREAAAIVRSADTEAVSGKESGGLKAPGYDFPCPSQPRSQHTTDCAKPPQNRRGEACTFPTRRSLHPTDAAKPAHHRQCEAPTSPTREAPVLQPAVYRPLSFCIAFSALPMTLLWRFSSI